MAGICSTTVFRIIQADPTIKPTLALCEGVPTWVLYHCPGTSPYSIGETGPAGGKVFYVTDGGLHGLEAAPIDQATSVWGCFGPSNTGAHNPNVGTGAENTAAIVAGCSEANTAAKVADAYVFNGFTDWFLPSSGELGLLYVQAHVVGGFTLGNYWSSTEYYAPNGGGWDSGGAWFQNFFYDVQFKYTNKFNAYRVRSIRTF